MKRTTPRTTSSLSNLVALLCLAASACSGSPAASASDDCRGFELTVSGSQAAEVCGVAISALDPGGENWGIQLFGRKDNSHTTINIWHDLTGRPSPGTYDIVDLVAADGSPAAADYVVFAVFDEAVLENTLENFLGNTFTSVTGTVTILSSSAGEVSGTFEFTAREGLVAGGPAVVTITGSFTAENEGG